MTTFRISSRGSVHESTVQCSPDGCTYVAMIDPESPEHIQRLAWHLDRQGWLLSANSRDELAAALREFAAPTPPKPAEPTGLGAVVEDADGTRWIRVAELRYPRAWAPDGEVSLDGRRACRACIRSRWPLVGKPRRLERRATA